MDLREVTQIIDSGQNFSARLIQANVAKGTGGKVLDIPKAKIARNSTVPERAKKATERKKDHNAHFTRNIELLPSHRIITIHPILVTHLNKEAIV